MLFLFWCAARTSVSVLRFPMLFRVQGKYDFGDKFTYTQALVWFLTAFNTIFAYFLRPKRDVDTVPTKMYAICSASYLGAMICSNQALQYLPYPTQVLFFCSWKLKNIKFGWKWVKQVHLAYFCHFQKKITKYKVNTKNVFFPLYGFSFAVFHRIRPFPVIRLASFADSIVPNSVENHLILKYSTNFGALESAKKIKLEIYILHLKIWNCFTLYALNIEKRKQNSISLSASWMKTFCEKIFLEHH